MNMKSVKLNLAVYCIALYKKSEYTYQDMVYINACYVLKHAETLTNGGYFETSLILNMVDGFLCASKDEKGTFHFTMNGIRKQVADLQQRLSL